MSDTVKEILPWIGWRVFAPLFGPILVAELSLWMWSTGPDGNAVNYFQPIHGITPWALVVYAITLLGTTINELRGKIEENKRFYLWLIVVIIFTLIYGAYIIIWNQQVAFQPTAKIYMITVLLFLAAVALSGYGYTISKKTG